MASVDEDVAPTVYASRAAYEAQDRPEDVDVIQLQDTDAGAEVIHMAENGFCADGEQEKLLAADATEITAPCRSTPMAASSPTVSRSAPRAFARSMSLCSSSAVRPATAKSKATRASATPRSMGTRHRSRHHPGPLKARTHCRRRTRSLAVCFRRTAQPKRTTPVDLADQFPRGRSQGRLEVGRCPWSLAHLGRTSAGARSR